MIFYTAEAGLSRDTGTTWLGIECAGRAVRPPEGGSPMPVSARIAAAAAAFSPVNHFYFDSRYARRRLAPDIADFTFGNPHEMPLEGIVSAIRARAVPRDENWFAYKTSETDPQAFIAEHAGRELGLAFEPADIALTAGAFGAIMVAFHLVLDVGDEAVLDRKGVVEGKRWHVGR